MSDSKTYNRRIMNHYNEPRNYGRMEMPDKMIIETNILCGDELRLELKLCNGIISDARFEARGCALSIAATSMLTEKIKGQSLEALLSFDKNYMFEILKIPPIKGVRSKCALLGLKAMRRLLFKETFWPV